MVAALGEDQQMSSAVMHNRMGSERIDERQISEIIGIAHGIISDGSVTQAEVEYLQKYLAAREHVTSNPVVRILKDRVDSVLADGVVDAQEAAELMVTLTAFAGGDFEHGEVTKSTSLPLCDPYPSLTFYGAPITFTGTFAYGDRRTCEDAARQRGANPGSLTQKTRYLVIGAYATESWSQSSFGRKIEQAVAWRSAGKPISIISEAHWVEQMASV
jgi:NAD-dependent DNA ligase